jgi:hypothetical protein
MTFGASVVSSLSGYPLNKVGVVGFLLLRLYSIDLVGEE